MSWLLARRGWCLSFRRTANRSVSPPPAPRPPRNQETMGRDTCPHLPPPTPLKSGRECRGRPVLASARSPRLGNCSACKNSIRPLPAAGRPRRSPKESPLAPAAPVLSSAPPDFASQSPPPFHTPALPLDVRPGSLRVMAPRPRPLRRLPPRPDAARQSTSRTRSRLLPRRHRSPFLRCRSSRGRGRSWRSGASVTRRGPRGTDRRRQGRADERRPRRRRWAVGAYPSSSPVSQGQELQADPRWDAQVAPPPAAPSPPRLRTPSPPPARNPTTQSRDTA